MMPSAATITGYRVAAYDSHGDVVRGKPFHGLTAMVDSLRLALEWEREGYIVEHEPITEDAHAESSSDPR